MRAVLPGVQQRVGDDVLLLEAQLVDDQIREARVAAAVGVRAGLLVGLLLVGAFEFLRFFECFFFGFVHRFEGLDFFFVQFLLRLEGLVVAGVIAAVLAFPAGGAVERRQVRIAEAAGRPGDHAVDDRVAVAGRQAAGVDRRVVAAEAVFVAFFGVLEVGAVAFGAAAVQADRYAGGGQQVIDAAHALRQAVQRDKAFELRGELRAGHADGRFTGADQVLFFKRRGVGAAGGRVGVGVRVGPVKDVLVAGRHIRLVRVLGVDGEDIRQRSAGPGDIVEVAVDHVLPVTVIVVVGVPVDGVDPLAVEHRVAFGVGVAFGDRFLADVDPFDGAHARREPDGGRTDRLHDGTRRHSEPQQPAGHHGEQEEDLRALAAGERRQVGHEPLIGTPAWFP